MDLHHFKRNFPTPGFFAAVALFSVLAFGPAFADSVKLRGKPVFQNVEVQTFRDGRLEFRGVSGQVLRKPLDQIEWFTMEAFPEFAAAEELAGAGRWAEAVPEFVLAADRTEEAWLRAWIQIRLLQALDRAGRFPEAVGQYLSLLASGSRHAGVTPPRFAGPAGSEENRKARDLLAGAIRDPAYGPVHDLLRGFLLELVILDCEEPVPAVLDLPDEVLPDRARAAGARPRAAPARPKYGLLPDRVALGRLPRLPENSFVLSHVASLIEDAAQPDPVIGAAEKPAGCIGDLAAALRRLEEALPFVADADVAIAALIEGRLEIQLGDYAAAIDSLARVGGKAGADPAVACEALYYSGLAQERAGRLEMATSFYREAADRRDCDENARQRAKVALRRLGTP